MTVDTGPLPTAPPEAGTCLHTAEEIIDYNVCYIVVYRDLSV